LQIEGEQFDDVFVVFDNQDGILGHATTSKFAEPSRTRRLDAAMYVA